MRKRSRDSSLTSSKEIANNIRQLHRRICFAGAPFLSPLCASVAAHGGLGTPWWLASARRKESTCIQSYRLYMILNNHVYRIYLSRNLSLHLDYTRSPSPDLRRELPPQGAERCFRSIKLTAKYQFVGLFVLLKHHLRCHPRTKRSGVKDLAQAPTARPDVYLFLKSYFCITKIRFITPPCAFV